ncbi:MULTISPECIES: hypothetical protein [Enterococcus]|uniref:Uncharacterized protein n=1 Tax=Enterococcus malodoratus ATCC 43197 TaxID=1158601 RepID=R2QUT5_9ENTE|nr:MULTISPECIES: hypothetical protein [Enterococcus]EOH75260.1 hypothetical protein UAI_03062 [Enterococcus malodoratus ATCC 43197]EOT66722.1 hypothetical protein I585_02243 [Enterococcus malodoratus ATCC 43197]SPW90744.1 Uncharacterised protein [Enterococcus malodoratus]STD70025.1 Uncharacterised protein [Enterococcus malodoratus]HCM87317.1 hypothetical protein [Enterococcus sp.]
MNKDKVIGVALAILAIIIIILYVLKNTLLSNMSINYIGLIIALVLIMNAVLVLILNPKKQNKLFVSRPIGYGLTINPRNPMGLLIYALLILFIFLITV